jgi:hypothetical protein
MPIVDPINMNRTLRIELNQSRSETLLSSVRLIANLNNFNQPDTNPESNMSDGYRYESLVKLNNYYNASRLSYNRNILFRSINNNRLLIVDFNFTIPSFDSFRSSTIRQLSTTTTTTTLDPNYSSQQQQQQQQQQQTKTYMDYLLNIKYPLFE